MKKDWDDLGDWTLRQENQKKPFPYVFPQMPPGFRSRCVWMRALFLLEWGCIFLFLLLILADGVLLLFQKDETPLFSYLGGLALGALALWPFCKLLRHSPKFFWHCPCCGRPFSYYSPTITMRGADELNVKECLYEMEHLRIQYVQPKYCPLIVPTVCPNCGNKFFKKSEEGITGEKGEKDE